MAIDHRRMTGEFVPLRDIMQQLVEGSFITPQSFTGQGTFPPVDLYVTDDDVIVELAVPGGSHDDLSISVTGETVTVTGEIKREPRGEKGHAYAQEIWQGKFQRSFKLPVQIDADKAEASFEQGILMLRLPKAEATKPRKIQIGKQHSVSSQIHDILESGVEKVTVGTHTH
jgi:HSP20 family protein